MKKFFKRKSLKAGTQAGTLIFTGEKRLEKVKISILDYNAEQLTEKKDVSIEESLYYMTTPEVSWIHIEGIHDVQAVESIGKHFGLHPLVLEDILNATQRSKLDVYKNNLFIVLRMLKLNGNEELEDRQVSLVLGPNYVISFLEEEEDIFNIIRERIHHKHNRIRRMGADYLAYAMIDAVVDHYFIILEKVDQRLEDLENELIHNPSPKILLKIQKAKREMSLLRKSVWPLREVINHFLKIEPPLVNEGTKLYFHDVYDHTIQAIETTESFRDVISGMLDVYLSTINQRLNEVMKMLTIVATVFAPLTVITGIYGMNFKYMPELDWRLGYPMALGLMVLSTLGMFLFFRHKKWF